MGDQDDAKIPRKRTGRQLLFDLRPLILIFEFRALDVGAGPGFDIDVRLAI